MQHEEEENGQASQIGRAPAPPTGRSQALDSFRGAAIAIMILDHVAGILFQQPIDGNPIRLFTRVSMPMFAVLTGYLLGKSDGISWKRLGQVGVAALMVNLATYKELGKVEILGSFLVCYVLHGVLKRHSWLMVLGILAALVRVDYSALLFDYPLSIVATCVGVGLAYRRFGLWGGAAGSALALCGIDWIPGHYAYSLYAVPIAFALLVLAQRVPIKSHVTPLLNHGSAGVSPPSPS